MRAKRSLVLIAASSALGVGLWAALERIPEVDSLPRAPISSSEAEVREDARNVAALRSEFDLLRAELRAIKGLVRDGDTLERELHSLKQEIAALGQQVAMIADDGEPSASLPQTREEMAQFEEDRTYMEEERRQELGAHFEAQSADTIWSLDTAELVSEAALSNQLARSSLDAVECRSSLCRVEVSHADISAANEFALRFPVAVGEALPQIRYFHEQREDGPLITVLYLARAGYDLPAEKP